MGPILVALLGRHALERLDTSGPSLYIGWSPESSPLRLVSSSRAQYGFFISSARTRVGRRSLNCDHPDTTSHTGVKSYRVGGAVAPVHPAYVYAYDLTQMSSEYHMHICIYMILLKVGGNTNPLP